MFEGLFDDAIGVGKPSAFFTVLGIGLTINGLAELGSGSKMVRLCPDVREPDLSKQLWGGHIGLVVGLLVVLGRLRGQPRYKDILHFFHGRFQPEAFLGLGKHEGL